MPRPAAPWLIVTGADVAKQFELDGESVGIGRDPANSIRLHDTESSRKHAEFRRDLTGFRIVDLGSANGTYVNTRRVQDTPILPGDHIQVGQTILVFTTGRGEAPADSNLADQIRMIGRQDETPSAIIKTIAEAEGSASTARPIKPGRFAVAPNPARQPGRHVRSHTGGQPHPRRRRVAGTDHGADVPVH